MFKITRFDSESYCGYKQFTTFYADFGIADHFGRNAVNDTFNRAFQEWRHDYKYLTELVLVLNWKSWEHSTRSRALSDLYANLYYKADAYALEHLKGEELKYYLRVTD